MAYTVSNEFKTKLYSGESEFRAILTINGITIPEEQIASISISSPIIDDDNKSFYLGTFISQKIKIKFKNMDGINVESGQEVTLSIGQYVNNNWEDVPIGLFLVDDLAENYQQKCEITCMDYAIKFRPNVDYSPCFVDGKATIDTILAYICNYFNVTLGDYPTTNGDFEVGTYDPTISGKQWISYIAEIKGCNAKMDRTGALTLQPIKQSETQEIDATSGSAFELGDKYDISKIVYYDAIRNYTVGNDSGNTLFIRTDNPFVSEDVIHNIADNIIWNGSTSTTGSEFSINNNVVGGLSMDEIEGYSVQLNTTGKNMFGGFNDIDNTRLGVRTIAINDSFNFKGTPSASGTGNWLMGSTQNLSKRPSVYLGTGTYTISVKNRSGSFGSSKIALMSSNETAKLVYTTFSSSFKSTFTVASAGTYYLDFEPSSTSYYNGTFNLQLETGSSSTSYEPYTGNAPSPSPSFPQEVKVVTGDNTLNISNKNILNANDYLRDSASNGITTTYENGMYHIEGTATTNNAYLTQNPSYLYTPIHNGQSFTFSITQALPFDIRFYINYGGAGTYCSIPAGSTSVTKSASGDVVYYYVQIYSGSSLTGQDVDYTIGMQVEYGSTKTDYIPPSSATYPLNLGKNLFNYTTINTNINGLTSVLNDDGSITTTGTTNASYVRVVPSVDITDLLEDGKSYTISQTIARGSSGGNNTLKIQVDRRLAGTTSWEQVQVGVGNKTNTFIVDKTTYDKYTICYLTGSTGEVIDETNYLQLEIGSSATEFAPYFEPIELCKIVDYKDKIFRTSGKNLLNVPDSTYTTQGITITTTNNKFSFVGTPTRSYVNTQAIPIDLPIGTYTISATNTNNNFYVWFRNENNVDVGAVQLYKQPRTITLTGNATKVLCGVETLTTGTAYNLETYFQIEKGSIKSDFEPYGSGKWYLCKEIGKSQITSSMIGSFQNVLTNSKEARVNRTTLNAKQGNTTFVCNAFTFTRTGTCGVDEVGIFGNAGANNEQVAFRIPVDDNTYFFTTHDVILYYPLATPTYTKITNEFLLDQLEAIKDAIVPQGLVRFTFIGNEANPILKVNLKNQTNYLLYSIKAKNIGDFSLDAWDIINYQVDSNNYMTLNNNSMTYNQTIMGEVNSKFGTEQQEVTTNVVKESVNSLKKKVYTEIDNINGSISLKVDKDGVINAINLSTEGTQIEGGKISLAGKTIEMTSDNIAIDSTNFKVTKDGDVTANNINAKGGKIANFVIDEHNLSYEIKPQYDYTQQDLTTLRNIIISGTTPTAEQLAKYDFNHSGTLNAQDVLRLSKMLDYGVSNSNPGHFEIHTSTNATDLDGVLDNKCGFYNGNDNLVTGFSYAGVFDRGYSLLDLATSNNELWSGVYYMNGSQTATLSQKISEQAHGIVLVWSKYASGQADDSSWQFHFVPKTFVDFYGSGNGCSFMLGGTRFSNMATKYLYISDGSIKGHADNTASGTASGITYNNSAYVLRYVIGV